MGNCGGSPKKMEVGGSGSLCDVCVHLLVWAVTGERKRVMGARGVSVSTNETLSVTQIGSIKRSR